MEKNIIRSESHTNEVSVMVKKVTCMTLFGAGARWLGWGWKAAGCAAPPPGSR